MPSSVTMSPRELRAGAEAPSGSETRPLFAGSATSAHASALKAPLSWPERDPRAHNDPTVQCRACTGTVRAGAAHFFWPRWLEVCTVLFVGYLKILSH